MGGHRQKAGEAWKGGSEAARARVWRERERVLRKRVPMYTEACHRRCRYAIWASKQAAEAYGQ